MATLAVRTETGVTRDAIVGSCAIGGVARDALVGRVARPKSCGVTLRALDLRMPVAQREAVLWMEARRGWRPGDAAIVATRAIGAER